MLQNNTNVFRSLCAAGSLLLAALATSCSDPGAIGNDLPTSTDKVGITYIDTFTVRTSTVLLDSIESSNSNVLMVGRYVDPRFGTIEARGFTQVGLGEPFTPSVTTAYDSLVLTLPTDALPYGDTTRTQQLLVQRLQEDFVDKKYYTLDALRYDATPLGQIGSTKAKEYTFRARPKARTISIRLDDALGRELYQLARTGTLNTNDDLQARFKGLVLSPGASDNAAILRYFLETTTSGGGLSITSFLNLYYHEAATPAEPILHRFPLTTSNSQALSTRHFYRLRANRSATLLAPLTRPYQAISSTATAAETYIQNRLGIYTRVDIPYINDLKSLGGSIAIISAELTIEGVQDARLPYLAPPSTLYLGFTDPSNRRGALVGTVPTAPVSQNNPPVAGTYARKLSNRNGLEQDTYTFQLTQYLQQVLNRNIIDNGLLLNPGGADDVSRVVLGAARNSTNPLQLKVYYARVQ